MSPRHRLSALLEPRSVALIGASDRSNWSNRINSALDTIGYDGELYYVNPRGGTAHGHPLATSVGELPVVPDLAFLMVPGKAVMSAITDAAAAGVKAAVILSSGFAEVGDAGRSAQAELADFCRGHDMVVLGPNALGYVNNTAKIALKPFPPGEELRAGSIAVVSQSGNVTVQLMNMARSFDVGLSFAVSTGNEMDVKISDVIDFLAGDESTRAIAVFAETFADPQAFLAAARRARAAGKLVVCLKVGRSVAAARAAMAHTGSLVGNDQVIDAFLRSAGVVRVSSLEDLLTVADTFSASGPINGDLALLTISGGSCDIVADLAEDVHVAMPDFADTTVEKLRELLPDFASVHNPLDITGAAVTDSALFGRCLEVVLSDPGIGVAIAAQEIDHQAENLAWGVETIQGLTDVAHAQVDTSVILANTTVRHVSPAVREIRRSMGAPAVFGGVDRILPAVRQIQRWTRTTQQSPAPEHSPKQLAVAAERTGTWTEATCRPLLENAGVPVVPGEIVKTADDAARAAAAWDSPVAIKIASDDIVHKSDIGGVALGVPATDVRARAQDVLDQVAQAAPAARIDGLLISPMRGDGVDLLIGVVNEPGWGKVLAIALGGIWTEVLRDVQRIALPATSEQIEEALRSLRAWPLLAGARGTQSVDVPAVCTAIQNIAELALDLSDDMAAVEVNPLRASPTGCEALDAAVIWR